MMENSMGLANILVAICSYTVYCMHNIIYENDASVNGDQ